MIYLPLTLKITSECDWHNSEPLLSLSENCKFVRLASFGPDTKSCGKVRENSIDQVAQCSCPKLTVAKAATTNKRNGNSFHFENSLIAFDSLFLLIEYSRKGSSRVGKGFFQRIIVYGIMGVAITIDTYYLLT